MKTQSKLRKKSFTVVEQAWHRIRGFKKFYEDLDDRVRLSGHSHSTLTNYARKPTRLRLYFGKLPVSTSAFQRTNSIFKFQFYPLDSIPIIL